MGKRLTIGGGKKMQKFNIELDAPSTPLVLYSMQGDSLSRFFQMTITQGGAAWTPPTGSIWTVRFGAPNMPAGWYDTITEVGGNTHTAVTFVGNTATVEIAEQAVSSPGKNVLCVLVTDATGYQIASWEFQLLVTAVPGMDAPEATVYYNALTGQVAESLANAQAAAASATLAQSWAVGGTGSRTGEDTNNAEYWSQQSAQSAQQAVGFRTMQGGAVLPINGDVDLTQPYPTETDASVTITSAADRIDSVTVNGYTTQTGSGDPSPTNIRSIENAGADGTAFVDVNGQQTQIPLQAPLHEGDTLETNVQSEYDAYAEFDGSSDENWLLDSGSTAGADGSKRMWIKLTGPQTENTSDKAVPVAASNQLTAQSAETTYIAKAANCFDVVYSGATNMLHVRIAGIATVEALKTHLQAHPLRVFYRSASGGTGKNVRRETHVKATVSVDGQTTLFTQDTNGYAVALPGAADGAVICNAFSGLSASSQSVTIPASAFPSTVTNLETANTWAQSQNVVIEYPLSTPEVYADTPVTIDNPQGTYTVSGESGTTCQVYMEALQNGGVANAVENSLTLQDAEGETQLTYDGSAASALKLTKAIVGLSNVDNTPDAQKNVKGLAVEQTDVITGLPTGLYYYKANTPGAPKTVDGLLLALVYSPFGVQLAFPTNGGIFFRWAVDNFSEWVRLDQ